MAELNTYFDFAQDDFNNFFQQRILGLKANSLGALAQSICERYLKHIVTEYCVVENEYDSLKLEKLLRTHSLHALISFIKNDMGIDVDREIVTSIKTIDGLYFSTRYPGEQSFTVDEDVIKDCETALVNCRQFVVDTVKNRSKETSLNFDLDENISQYVNNNVESFLNPDFESKNEPKSIKEQLKEAEDKAKEHNAKLEKIPKKDKGLSR